MGSGRREAMKMARLSSSLIVILMLQRCNSFALSAFPSFAMCADQSVSKQIGTPTSRKSDSSWHFTRLYATHESETVQDKAIYTVVNGHRSPWNELVENLNVTAEVNENQKLPTSPSLSYSKFLTMQDKRVIVTIRYSEKAGLRPYFLTVAKKMKALHPDVIVERRILPAVDKDDGGEATFEVLVDGKIVVGKSRPRKQKVARVDMGRARSVFVSMQELEANILRARRRRRPSTVYGEELNDASVCRNEVPDPQER
jgi:hypothetical protein